MGFVRRLHFYIHVSGEKLSESVAKLLGLMLPESSNVLKKLMGVTDVNRELAIELADISRANKNGDFADAYSKLTSLPLEVQSTQVISMLKVHYANLISEEEYFKQLTLLDKYHGDKPELFFMLIDYYFYTDKFDRAFSSLEKLQKRFKNESEVSYLQSIICYSKKDYSCAVEYSKLAISQDNSDEDYYWFLAAAYNANRQFSELVRLFNDIMVQFDVIFDPELFQQDPDYQMFAQSDAFALWKKELLASDNFDSGEVNKK